MRRIMQRLLLLLLIAAIGCVGYKPAPLSVHVTSDPTGARAELRCPQQRVRATPTPARFRVPQYAMPCTLTLQKQGFAEHHREIRIDSIRPSSPTAPPRPIHFQETATPLSLLGALIVRSLDNFGARVGERLTTAVTPDAEIHVTLEPED